jgi:FtsH-binding integral membrane protein
VPSILHVSNLLWLIASVAAFALILPRVPSRRGRAAVIIACAVALLFPIISISDDFAEDGGALAQLLATLVAAFVALTLAFVARIAPPQTYLPAFAPATKSDPRSPPRR